MSFDGIALQTIGASQPKAGECCRRKVEIDAGMFDEFAELLVALVK